MDRMDIHVEVKRVPFIEHATVELSLECGRPVFSYAVGFWFLPAVQTPVEDEAHCTRCLLEVDFLFRR
jgi:hypothetical protein